MEVIIAKPPKLFNPLLFLWLDEQARYYGVKLHYIYNVDMIELFPNYDYGIGYLFPQKIPTIEFSKNKHWLNFHPGPLPEMGGRDLAYTAICRGEKTFGATIHWMDENFDTGPIIECQRFDIEEHHTADDLVKISHDILDSFVRKYVPALFREELNRLDFQEKQTITYYKKQQISNEIYLEDWQKRMVRALYCPPHYPYVVIGGKRFKLVKDE